MPYVVYPSASSSLNNYTQRFTSSTTWVAPTGCKLIDLVCVGGGGGGGYAGTTSNVYNGGGGGAGGEVVRRQLAVTAGQSYQIIVGAGGAGGIAAGTGTDTSTPAQAGGYSAFNIGYTLENAVFNGAGERTNTTIFGGSGNNISTGTFPTWTAGYTSGAPTTGEVSSWSTPSPAITGISSYWRHATSYSSSGTNHGTVAAWVPITGSTQYTYSSYLQGVSAAALAQGNIRVDYYTALNGSLISGVSGTQSTVNGNTTWNRYTLTDTSPSNATYALFRTGWWHQNAGSSGQYNVTGIQVEPTSSVTAYVGLDTAGIRYISSLGILTNITGVLAEGGGGGDSAFGSSQGNGVGNGGGANHPVNTSAPWYAGNGSGAGGQAGDPTIFSTGNTATTNFFYATNVNYPSSTGNLYFGTGSPGVVFHSTGAFGRQPNGAPATFDGFGAGGMGACRGLALGQNGYGAGQSVAGNLAGVSALANTGAGGGGAANYAATALRSGGNGGSGIVLISYLAE